MRECNGYTCKGFRMTIVVGQPIYQEGIKFCKTCEEFLEIDSYRCPCCKSSVRTKSHSKQWRERFSHVLL
jgi:predicted amidophosphoribosyltransferase